MNVMGYDIKILTCGHREDEVPGALGALLFVHVLDG
jgi:hypothetical protein